MMSSLLALWRTRRWNNLHPTAGTLLDIRVVGLGILTEIPIILFFCWRLLFIYLGLLLHNNRWLRIVRVIRVIIWIIVGPPPSPPWSPDPNTTTPIASTVIVTSVIVTAIIVSAVIASSGMASSGMASIMSVHRQDYWKEEYNNRQDYINHPFHVQSPLLRYLLKTIPLNLPYYH
jgi:hypothetical protein